MRSYLKTKNDIKKWLFQNRTDGLELFADTFGWMKEEYIEVQTRIDIAFEIIENSEIWEEDEREKFIEENDAVFATQEIIWSLDIYDLPRAYIILLPIELFERALETLLEKLEELDLIEEYYEIVEE